MADPVISMIKGHFIHGSGTATVYHHRALTQRNGVWPTIQLHQSTQALTITEEGANSFQVNCAGAWKITMLFLEPAES